MRSIADILSAIADPGRPVIPGRTVLVFAHPDDETLACHALLSRLSDPWIVHVTDGAPPDGADARRAGCASVAAYAEARREEARDAAALSGIAADRLSCLGHPDQGAAPALAAIVRQLEPVLSEADIVVTHAAEGGHPDHDATAWAVHATLSRLAVRPVVLEVPLYRLGQTDSWLRQRFAEPAGSAILRLDEGERVGKARALGCHRSQRETLDGFGIADESFRPARAIPPGTLPNGGALLYERFGWGMTGADWLRWTAAARLELGGAGQGA